MIEANALSWDTPVPLMWAPENNGGHQGAQVVGWITDIQRDGSAIRGSGAFDLGSDIGREAYRQVKEGLTPGIRSEEHTSELQSLMRISYAVFCLTKKKKYKENTARTK